MVCLKFSENTLKNLFIKKSIKRCLAKKILQKRRFFHVYFFLHDLLIDGGCALGMKEQMRRVKPRIFSQGVLVSHSTLRLRCLSFLLQLLSPASMYLASFADSLCTAFHKLAVYFYFRNRFCIMNCYQKAVK